MERPVPVRAARSVRSMPIVLLALAASSVAGCGGERSVGPSGGTSLVAAETTLDVDAAAATISLRRGDTVLLRLPADGIELGKVAALDDAVNYDPYRLYVPIPLYTPPAIEWLPVAAMHVVSATRSVLRADLDFGEETRATLSAEVTGDDRIRLEIVPATGGETVAYYRLRPTVDPDEGFYGLGEAFDSVNHRGKVRAMQLELALELESSNNEAHVPVPFVLGTTGWGMFVESNRPGVFALGTTSPDRVEAAFGTGLASPAGLVFHFLSAGHPLDVVRRYYEITGFPRLPARWALGPLVWRNESEDQAEVESDLRAMRDLDLAASGYWVDRPYANAVNTFDFEAARFPDPASMIGLAHDLGFRVALWHAPYLDVEAPATAALRAEANTRGFFPSRAGLRLNDWSDPFDFTAEGATDWWQGLLRRYTDLGVEGFKLDYGEDVVPGLTSSRNVFAFADGSDERTMHADYRRFYHRAYAQMLPEDGGFLLCRAGTWGSQLDGPIVWPGDLDASFARFGERVDDGEGGTYGAVGGLPAAVVAGLSLGPSGFPFFASDTGGYRHSPPDKELFTRWFEHTALTAAMQIGTGSSDVAWESVPGNGFDEEMLGWYRDYTRLHLRLFPYLWTYARRLLEDGRPITRALGLAHPELGIHPDDTYLLGDALLVAPVVERGRRSREVTLPAGRWFDWWDGTAVEGGRTLAVEAPLEKLPLFLAAGGIVPLLRPTIDTLAPVADPARIDSFASRPGPVHARVAPGPESRFVLYDGAEIGQSATDGRLALSWRDGAEFREGAVLEVVALGSRPAAVSIDGAPAVELSPGPGGLDAAAQGWAFETALGGTLRIRVGPGRHDVEATLR